ncbi:MAG: YcnI family protein [Rhodospirillaceae bacterium]|nr:YcnI family protein [Rhodospirillaceae bacterium]
MAVSKFALALAGVVGISSGALAHATLMVKEAKPGAWQLVEVGIPHGCVGEPTTTIKLKLPDGVVNARPQVKPGWNLCMTMRKLEKPIIAEGVNLTEVADEVTWTGGSLGDMEFDRFGVFMKLPNDPGRTVYFKTIQQCAKGEHRWIEIPADGKTSRDYKEPAPAMKLSDAAQ